MNQPSARSGLQLRSTIKRSGELELSLVDTPVPAPAADEVVIRVEASPINPSDIGLLFGAADMSTATASGNTDRPVLTAKVPDKLMRAMAGRLDQSMPVGNEGAGTVVEAGSSPAAQALLGRTVAAIGGAMYSQLRCVQVDQCLPLPAGTKAADGASCFVNPLTALGMVETMRMEGHKALVHTAAASNLGQMLNRICIADGIASSTSCASPSRKSCCASSARAMSGNATSPTFLDELTEALVATRATIAFDAIGGGRLAGQILSCMEAAVNRTTKEYSRYGSAVPQQVYIYGGLDMAPTEFVRNFGMAWGMGGWLLFPFLQKIGAAAGQKLRARVAAELKTTFASHYAREISLAEALQPDVVAIYNQRATGEKFLLAPNRGLS